MVRCVKPGFFRACLAQRPLSKSPDYACFRVRTILLILYQPFLAAARFSRWSKADVMRSPLTTRADVLIGTS
jgi:hypothetical protein